MPQSVFHALKYPTAVLMPCCRILHSASNPDGVRWLPGAKLNIAETALCNSSPDATAIIWADESSPSQLATVSWSQLKQHCQHVGAALVAAGFKPGMPQQFVCSEVTVEGIHDTIMVNVLLMICIGTMCC